MTPVYCVHVDNIINVASNLMNTQLYMYTSKQYVKITHRCSTGLTNQHTGVFVATLNLF